MKSGKCRYCLECTIVTNLLEVCKCKGSLRYVHKQCLKNWIKVKEDLECEICKQPFELKRKKYSFLNNTRVTSFIIISIVICITLSSLLGWMANRGCKTSICLMFYCSVPSCWILLAIYLVFLRYPIKKQTDILRLLFKQRNTPITNKNEEHEQFPRIFVTAASLEFGSQQPLHIQNDVSEHEQFPRNNVIAASLEFGSQQPLHIQNNVSEHEHFPRNTVTAASLEFGSQQPLHIQNDVSEHEQFPRNSVTAASLEFGSQQPLHIPTEVNEHEQFPRNSVTAASLEFGSQQPLHIPTEVNEPHSDAQVIDP